MRRTKNKLFKNSLFENKLLNLKKSIKLFNLKKPILTISAIFLSISFWNCSLTSIYASTDVSTYGYYIKCLLDEGSFGVLMQVVPDKGATLDSTGPIERSAGITYSKIIQYQKVRSGEGATNSNQGSSLIVDFVYDSGSETSDDYQANLNSSDSNGSNYSQVANEAPLVFTFPGVTKQIKSDVKYTATTADLERATLVSTTLSKGLNDALNFIKYHSGKTYVSSEGLREVLAQIARITSQFKETATTETLYSYNGSIGEIGKKVYFQQVVESDEIKEVLTPINGLTYSDYVEIRIEDSSGEFQSAYFPWRIEKGYREGQALYELTTQDYRDYSSKLEDRYKENKYLTWGQCIIQAAANYDVASTSTVASASDDMITLIGKGLGLDLTSTISSVRGMLNLASIQELILNMGTRAGTHYYGVMTEDMYATAKSIYVLIFAISVLFLSVLIVKIIHQKMMSTTNIGAKTSLMEGLQDIIFTGVMLSIFPGIFELLLELNFWIVETFSFSSSFLQAYGLTSSKVLATESLAGFMVSSMFLSIDVYINITYLVRAIVVSFLYVISPLMAVSYCWGVAQKKLYFSYLRELVGNIFMQSFHAITMSFFAGYNTLNMSSLEAIAATYCFIPITQLFRSLVMGGTSGGFSESLGGKLAGQITNTASGLHKSNVAMRQSKEMANATAENTAKTAELNMWSAIAQGGSDTIFNTMNAMNRGNAGDNGLIAPSKKSGIGQGVANGLIGVVSTAAAYDRESKNQKKLGELEMKHSMENVGIGLAQAGMGMGIDSYDSGSGMISQGLSTVQSAAKSYGEGQSHTEIGGKNKALEKSYNMLEHSARHISGNASRAAQDYRKDERKYNQELDKLQAKEQNIARREITASQGFAGMGIHGIADNDITFRPEGTTNNVVYQLNANALKGATGDSPILKYLQDSLNNQPISESARQNASNAGLQINFGNQGMTVDKDGNVSFIIKDVNRYGQKVEEHNDKYYYTAITDNTLLNTIDTSNPANGNNNPSSGSTT